MTELELLTDLLVVYINESDKLSKDFGKKQITTETVKQSISRLAIFSNTLSYTLSMESPKMDLVSLLGSIGGNLGLFLNIGFFSLCEIFTVFIEILFVFKRKKVNPKKIVWK